MRVPDRRCHDCREREMKLYHATTPKKAKYYRSTIAYLLPQAPTGTLATTLKHLKGFDDIYQRDNVTTVKLKPDGTRILKATHLNFTRNGKNYDIQFCQKINAVYCPSTKTNKEPRVEILEELTDVPLAEIISQINWVIEGKKKICTLGHPIDYSLSMQDRPCWGCKQETECREKYMEVGK